MLGWLFSSHYMVNKIEKLRLKLFFGLFFVKSLCNFFPSLENILACIITCKTHFFLWLHASFIGRYSMILLTWHRCIISRLMHKIFLRSSFIIYSKFYNNLASTYADNETFCTVLLTSQVVMVQSLQPKGHAFESMCVLLFLLTFIRFV